MEKGLMGRGVDFKQVHSAVLTDYQCPGGGPHGPEDAAGLPPAADRCPGGEQSD